MKLKEMYEHCARQKGKCDNCLLNCIENWQEDQMTWCLISLKKNYIALYQEELNNGNKVLAERIQKRYEELEKKYLNQNKETEKENMKA